MPSVEQMREYLKGFYGISWREKVNKMQDNQVIATYYNFKKKEEQKK